MNSAPHLITAAQEHSMTRTNTFTPVGDDDDVYWPTYHEWRHG